MFDISCLYVQFRQAVDGVLLQLVNGAGIFLDVLQSAMTEDACYSLDVEAIVEEIDGAGIAGAVPRLRAPLIRLANSLVGLCILSFDRAFCLLTVHFVF